MNPTHFEEQNQNASTHERPRGGRGQSAHASHDGEHRRLELARLVEVGRNLGTQIDQQVQKRPYMVVGAAAGVGFVAGSLFGSRLGQVLLAAGLGYVARNVLGGELGVERIQQGLEKLTGEAGTG